MERLKVAEALRKLGFDTTTSGFDRLCTVLAYTTERSSDESFRMKEALYEAAWYHKTTPSRIRGVIVKTCDKWCFAAGETREFRNIMGGSIRDMTFPTLKKVVIGLTEYLK